MIRIAIEICPTTTYSNFYLSHRNQAGYVPSNYVKKEKKSSSLFDSFKKKVKKGTGSRTLPNCSPSRQVDSPTMGRKLPPDPSETIGKII